jgi:hypothetical protein
MSIDPAVQREFVRLLWLARDLPADLEEEVEMLVYEAADSPVDVAEARGIVDRVLARLEERTADDDPAIEIVRAAAQVLRGQLDGKSNGRPPSGVPALTKRLPVKPSPRFAGRTIPMWRFLVDPRDPRLWIDNDRIEVHVEQFRKVNSRDPSDEEIFRILSSKEHLEGVDDENEFDIDGLAEDIAAFGLERPAILDQAGQIRDGNRRIAACRRILQDPEYGDEAKERVRLIEVHQLSEHATEEDAEWVVTTLNFRRDQKKEWSDYIKARKIYREWQRMTTLRPDATARELADMRKDLARRFAMGNRTDAVARYIRMVDLAEEFETFMVDERHEDPFTVRHRAMERFQFFDELTKGGKRTRGPAHALEQSDRLRELVFDLLYQGKFQNWNLVRDLKFAADNNEVLDELERARDLVGDDEKETRKKAQRMVKNAMTEARQSSPEAVETSADLRISQFVTWLEKMSPAGYERSVSLASLRNLQRALKLVEGMVERLISEREARTGPE